MSEERQKLIDSSWSDYCDLDGWITEMTRSNAMPPKYVLKMAMKHLRSNFYDIHKFLCEEQDKEDRR